MYKYINYEYIYIYLHIHIYINLCTYKIIIELFYIHCFQMISGMVGRYLGSLRISQGICKIKSYFQNNTKILFAF